MKSLIIGTLLAAVNLGTALASSLPASKAAAQVNTVTTCVNGNSAQANNPCTNTDGSGRWLDVMSTQIKTSNVADLFAGVTLVIDVFSSTTCKGKCNVTTSY